MYPKTSYLTGAVLTWGGSSSSCSFWIPGNLGERGPWPQPPSATPVLAATCFPGQPVSPAASTHSSSAPWGCLDCRSFLLTHPSAATNDTYARAQLVWNSLSFSFKGESNLCLYFIIWYKLSGLRTMQPGSHFFVSEGNVGMPVNPSAQGCS